MRNLAVTAAAFLKGAGGRHSDQLLAAVSPSDHDPSMEDAKDTDRVEYIKPDFPADAFAGTAEYYVRYRAPYPERLLRDLIARAAVSGDGRLLDLACGPGRVALALVRSFREVWAIDLEPEMVEAGQKEAAKRGVNKIRWTVGKAEEMEVPPASAELVTIGDAFHRLDQQLMVRQALGWLKPRCCLAILGSSYGLLGGTEPWQRIVAGTARKWTGEVSGRPMPGSSPEHAERVLRESGYADVASYPFVEPHVWTIEAITGYLYSTSICSRNALGEKAAPFEAELKAALLAHDAGGSYREEARFGYTLARRKV